MGEQAKAAEWLSVWVAAGKTEEELHAIGRATHRFNFSKVSEEDPTDPRPLVRQLRFPNLTQAVEFAKLFDGGAQADVWLSTPGAVELFDHPVTLSVVFRLDKRPAVVHGEDDMRDVARALRAGR